MIFRFLFNYTINAVTSVFAEDFWQWCFPLLLLGGPSSTGCGSDNFLVCGDECGEILVWLARMFYEYAKESVYIKCN